MSDPPNEISSCKNAQATMAALVIEHAGWSRCLPPLAGPLPTAAAT
jgi:hypothetical protein